MHCRSSRNRVMGYCPATHIRSHRKGTNTRHPTFVLSLTPSLNNRDQREIILNRYKVVVVQKILKQLSWDIVLVL